MRVEGPTARPGHRALTAAQRDAVEAVRQARRAFIATLHMIGGTDPALGRLASADLTLAMRHVEDAEHRAVRHVTGGPVD